MGQFESVYFSNYSTVMNAILKCGSALNVNKALS